MVGTAVGSDSGCYLPGKWGGRECGHSGNGRSGELVSNEELGMNIHRCAQTIESYVVFSVQFVNDYEFLINFVTIIEHKIHINVNEFANNWPQIICKRNKSNNLN